jgi:ABC-type glutathione transport system ATPase component
MILFTLFPLFADVETKQEFAELDDDVQAEDSAVLNGEIPADSPVVLKNLTKSYQTKKLFRKKEEFLAVKDLTFHIERDNLFCLLGPNGAGKVQLPSFSFPSFCLLLTNVLFRAAQFTY